MPRGPARPDVPAGSAGASGSVVRGSVVPGVAVGALAGAAVVAASWRASDLGRVDHVWVVVGDLLVAIALAAGLPRVRAWLPEPGRLPALAVVAAAAVFGCVPETSDQMGYVAILVVGALIVELVSRRTLAPGWHLTAALVVLWSGSYGATGRQSAHIGAFAAMWPLLVLPALTVVLGAGRSRLDAVGRRARIAIVVQAAVASLVVARTGGIAPRTDTAIWWALPLLAGSATLAVLIVRLARAEAPPPGPGSAAA